jgi:signal transduction histidine kinase
MEELLTNTLKHANASDVNVNLSSKDDLLIIEYMDDGIGITETANLKRGRGLQNIESRLKVIKGYYSQYPNTGKGYGVRICIPVNII